EQVGHQPIAATDPNLDDVGRATDVKMFGRRDQLVAGPAASEHVQLHLHGREVVPGRQVPEGLPGGDRVGERHPGAAVDQAARMEVAVVDHDAASAQLVRDLEWLDPHVGGEAALDPLADRLDRDLRLGLRHGGAGTVTNRYPLKVERPKSPNGSSRSRTAWRQPASPARRANPCPSAVWRATPSSKVPSTCVECRPCAYSDWLTSSLCITSWLTGTSATRARSASKRASRRSAGAASVASPQSTASVPEIESPVSRRRFARAAPIRQAQSAVVGTP